MSGFFNINKDEFEAKATYDYTKMEADAGCMECGLFAKCKNPQLKATGMGRKNCLIVAEANGPSEDEIGTQLVGHVGQFLREKLIARGLDLDRDFWKINAINCCPYDEEGSFREPADEEITLCRPFVEQAIQQYKPKFIWIFGNASLKSFFGDYFKIKMDEWRGYCIPDVKYNAYIMPMYHPSWASRHADSAKWNEISVWDRDLDRAIENLELSPFTVEPLRKEMNIIYDYQDVIDCLDALLKHDKMAVFDYETTGLKPFVTGHKIATISFATHNGAWSFPYEYTNHFTEAEQAEIRKRWKRFLFNKARKVAQNSQFEQIWTRQMFGCEIRNIHRCTMLTSHVLDSRRGITNLDRQLYLNFGHLPYSNEIKKYLTSDNSNSFNNIMKAPLEKLLDYGCLDSRWTFKLYHKQDKELTLRSERNPNIYRALQLLQNGVDDFSKMTCNGIPIREDYYNETRKRIRLRKTQMEDWLVNTSPDGKLFHQKYNEKFNLSSDDHKRKMFYEVLKLEEQHTAKGNLSVSKTALAQLDSKFLKWYQKIAQLKDIDGKYIAQFLREVTNGRIHPFYHLHIANTYRSSSSDPNWHNIPVHDDEAMEACRSGVFASLGNRLMEWDYGGIEVCAGCFYHKDPQMIKYVTDPTTDMHRDAAMDLVMLPQFEVTSEIRFHCGKNGWVFPQFYGSYYVKCAKAMWLQIRKDYMVTNSGKRLVNHLDTMGIRKYEDFEEHCKGVERVFWEEQFAVYNEWKKIINEEYKRKGYLTTLFGFECGGMLGQNDCTNHPIQGTAFHMLLWTKIQVTKIREKENWLSQSLTQIHDSGLEDQVPDEQPHAMRTIHHLGTKRIREIFDFINVPLTIDFEQTDIDQPWSTKKKIGEEEVEKILST